MTLILPGLHQCDMRHPQCRQCLRRNLQCSAPVDGVMFIDMAPVASSAHVPSGRVKVDGNVRKQKPGKQTGYSGREYAISDRTLSTANHRQPALITGEEPCRPFNDSSSVQITAGNITDNEDQHASLSSIPTADNQPSNSLHCLNFNCSNEKFFVGRFVDLIASPRKSPRSWLQQLPSIISTTRLPCVRFSIRAAALMYYAATSRDDQAKVLALRWSFAAIETYRAKMQPYCQQSLTGKPVFSEPDFDSEIYCVPMLLQYVRHMRGVKIDAFPNDIATCNVLEAIGPSRCSTGLEHRIFRSTRSLEVRYLAC